GPFCKAPRPSALRYAGTRAITTCAAAWSSPRRARSEIATAGPGMRCDIAGGITVEPGGRLVIGAPGRPKFTCVTRGTVAVRGTEAARGAITVRNSTFELLGPYDLDATFKFAGGRLITSDGVLIGGAKRGGRNVTLGFDLTDGIWEATDTTVQLIAG